MILKWNHFSEIEPNEWKWKWFTPKELACRHCGELHIDQELLDKLEIMRENYGDPVVISSGYRCPIHNARIKGAPLSLHVKGKAVDILLNGKPMETLHKRGLSVGFRGFGFYDGGWIHMDVGRPRTWKGQ